MLRIISIIFGISSSEVIRVVNLFIILVLSVLLVNLIGCRITPYSKTTYKDNQSIMYKYDTNKPIHKITYVSQLYQHANITVNQDDLLLNIEDEVNGAYIVTQTIENGISSNIDAYNHVDWSLNSEYPYPLYRFGIYPYNCIILPNDSNLSMISSCSWIVGERSYKKRACFISMENRDAFALYRINSGEVKREKLHLNNYQVIAGQRYSDMPEFEPPLQKGNEILVNLSCNGMKVMFGEDGYYVFNKPRDVSFWFSYNSISKRDQVKEFLLPALKKFDSRLVPHELCLAIIENSLYCAATTFDPVSSESIRLHIFHATMDRRSHEIIQPLDYICSTELPLYASESSSYTMEVSPKYVIFANGGNSIFFVELQNKLNE